MKSALIKVFAIISEKTFFFHNCIQDNIHHKKGDLISLSYFTEIFTIENYWKSQVKKLEN